MYQLYGTGDSERHTATQVENVIENITLRDRFAFIIKFNGIHCLLWLLAVSHCPSQFYGFAACPYKGKLQKFFVNKLPENAL